MKRLKRHLLLWYLRPVRPLLAGGAAVSFIGAALLKPPLETEHTAPILFLFALAVLANLWSGRHDTTAGGFLIGRGFHRGDLWLHATLAPWLVLVAAWAGAALAVWTPVRAVVQSAVLGMEGAGQPPLSTVLVPVEWLMLTFTLGSLASFALLQSARPGGGNRFRQMITGGTTAAVGAAIVGGACFLPLPAPYRLIVVGILLVPAGYLFYRTKAFYERLT